MKNLINGFAYVIGGTIGAAWTVGFLVYLSITGQNGTQVRFWLPPVGYTDCNKS